MLTQLFKGATFSPPPNLYTCISLVKFYVFRQCLGPRFSPISTFFTLVGSRAVRDAPPSRFRCGDLNQFFLNYFLPSIAIFCPLPTLDKFVVLLEVYQSGQWLDWRFSPISTFFSLLSFRAFRDAPHPRFRSRDPNQWLLNFLKMLVLALFQICNVYFTCGILDLDSP